MKRMVEGVGNEGKEYSIMETYGDDTASTKHNLVIYKVRSWTYARMTTPNCTQIISPIHKSFLKSSLYSTQSASLPAAEYE